MTLASRISATRRRPTATVRLNGVRWDGVLSLSRSQAYGQGISGGEVVGRDPPVTIVEGETTISWTWGYDGYEAVGFTGIVTKILRRAYPNRWTVQVSDPLWLANIRRGDLVADPINNIAASTAVEQLLDDAGVGRLNIPTLPASGSAWVGSEWVLGTLTPVSWSNTTALAAAQEICETLGYWLYCDASGTVRATLMERRPSSSPVRTLRWGEDFLLAAPPERETDAANVRNRIKVLGANTGVQGAQISDVWQTGAADRSLEATYRLIEYVNESEAGKASCTGVAKRLLKLWSREPNLVRIGKVKADPRLSVGQTVAVVCSKIGYSSATPFFIYSLTTSLDLAQGDFSQSLILDGGTGDQGYTTIPPPSASFIWRIVRQTLNGTSVIEVFLDGTGSTSGGDGEIVSYAWTTATATALSQPSSASGPKAMFVYPAAATTASVTLTVTDTTSKTGSITQVIPLAGDALVTPVSRTISLALGAAWAVTPDGGSTWNVETSGDSTVVPETSAGPLLSTRASGSTGLRQTLDGLASASTNLASLGGQIVALSVTPGTGIVWAAVGATLYRSADAGVTFSAWGTLPATINGVLEDPVVPSSVFVLAGANMYHSTLNVPGSTGWVVLYAGPTGATARQLVRGQSGATTWICYTGTFSGSALQRVEGGTSAVFTGASPAVAEVRAIALAPDELTVYAWDAQGRGWSVASATGLATAITATLAGGETAQHALHDPDDQIVYLATFGASAGTTYKYFPLGDWLAAFYVPASGQQAHRIGLGGPVVTVGSFIRLPLGQSGAADKIWFHLTSGWVGKTPPEVGRSDWRMIVASPFDARRLLLWRWDSAAETNRLWLSTDGGDSWTSVFQNLTMRYDYDGYAPTVEWSATTTTAWVTVQDPSGANAHNYLVRGDGASYTTPFDGAGAYDRMRIGVGMDNDVIVARLDGAAGYISDGNTATMTAPGVLPDGRVRFDRQRLTRKAVALATNQALTAYVSQDYRAGTWSAISGTEGSGGAVTALADGTALIGGRTAGVQEVAGAWSSASITTALGANAIGHVRADRQTQTTAAAVITDSGTGRTGTAYRDSSGSWTVIAGPAGVTELADWVEATSSG